MAQCVVERCQGPPGGAPEVDLDPALRPAPLPEGRQHDEFRCRKSVSSISVTDSPSAWSPVPSAPATPARRRARGARLGARRRSAARRGRGCGCPRVPFGARRFRRDRTAAVPAAARTGRTRRPARQSPPARTGRRRTSPSPRRTWAAGRRPAVASPVSRSRAPDHAVRVRDGRAQRRRLPGVQRDPRGVRGRRRTAAFSNPGTSRRPAAGSRRGRRPARTPSRSHRPAPR